MTELVFNDTAPEPDPDGLELTSNQDVEEHYLRRAGDAIPACIEVWQNAEENEQFVWGGEDAQWEGDSAQQRRNQGRPVLIENQTARVINIITGREVTSRVRPEYTGTDETDDAWLAICRRYLKHTRSVADHEQAESEGFRGCMIGNIAWLGWRQDRMRGPVSTGMTVVEPIPVWEMLWDYAAREKNLLDRVWDARGYWVSFEEFSGMFDEDSQEIAEAALAAGNEYWVDGGRAGRGRNWPFELAITKGRYLAPQRREVFLVHYIWKEMTEHYYAKVSGPGEPPVYHVFETKEELEVAGEAAVTPIAYTPVPRWKYRQAYFAGRKMVLESDLPYREFPRQALTGIPYKQPDRTRYYGPVDMGKDTQRMKNAVGSMLVMAVQMTSKGNTFAEEGALKSPTTAAKQIPKAGQLIILKKDGLQRVKEMPAAQLPPNLVQLYEYVDRAFYNSLGINPGALGDLGSDLRRISGNVVQSVKEAATLSMATIFDSLRLYRKIAGRLTLDFMRAHLMPDDLARIVGPKLSVLPPPVDPATGQPMGPPTPLIPPKEEWESMSLFDIEVDESDSTADEQLKAAELLVQTGLLPQEVASGRAPASMVPKIMSRFMRAEDAQQWIEHAEKMEAAMLGSMGAPEEEEPQ